MLKPRKHYKAKIKRLLKLCKYGAVGISESISFSRSVATHKRYKRLTKRHGQTQDWGNAVALTIGIKVPLKTLDGRVLNSVIVVRKQEDVPEGFEHLWDEFKSKRTFGA